MAVAPRLAKLTGKLEQEEQDREAACGALQKSQEEASQRVDHEVARMQVPWREAGPDRALASVQPAEWPARGSI